MRPHWSRAERLAATAAVVLLGVAACAPAAPSASPAMSATATGPAVVAVPPASALAGVPGASGTAGASPAAGNLAPTTESTPYPYTTPLPPLDPTILDGFYTKFDPKPGTPVPCQRCPDYKPEGGEWVLRFDKGIFRVYHPAMRWRTVGSFTVSGDQVTLFNDPACHKEVGTYTWKREGNALTLQVIADSCAIGLRAKTLTMQPWTRAAPSESSPTAS